MYAAEGSHFVPLAYWNVNSDSLLSFWALAASVLSWWKNTKPRVALKLIFDSVEWTGFF